MVDTQFLTFMDISSHEVLCDNTIYVLDKSRFDECTTNNFAGIEALPAVESAKLVQNRVR